jgi:hypothetical protein
MCCIFSLFYFFCKCVYLRCKYSRGAIPDLISENSRQPIVWLKYRHLKITLQGTEGMKIEIIQKSLVVENEKEGRIDVVVKVEPEEIIKQVEKAIGKDIDNFQIIIQNQGIGIYDEIKTNQDGTIKSKARYNAFKDNNLWKRIEQKVNRNRADKKLVQNVSFSSFLYSFISYSLISFNNTILYIYRNQYKKGDKVLRIGLREKIIELNGEKGKNEKEMIGNEVLESRKKRGTTNIKEKARMKSGLDKWNANDFLVYINNQYKKAYGKGNFEIETTRQKGKLYVYVKGGLIDSFVKSGMTKEDVKKYIDWVYGVKVKKGNIVIGLSLLCSKSLINEWVTVKDKIQERIKVNKKRKHKL